MGDRAGRVGPAAVRRCIKRDSERPTQQLLVVCYSGNRLNLVHVWCGGTHDLHFVDGGGSGAHQLNLVGAGEDTRGDLLHLTGARIGVPLNLEASDLTASIRNRGGKVDNQLRAALDVQGDSLWLVRLGDRGHHGWHGASSHNHRRNQYIGSPDAHGGHFAVLVHLANDTWAEGRGVRRRAA